LAFRPQFETLSLPGHIFLILCSYSHSDRSTSCFNCKSVSLRREDTPSFNLANPWSSSERVIGAISRLTPRQAMRCYKGASSSPPRTSYIAARYGSKARSLLPFMMNGSVHTAEGGVFAIDWLNCMAVSLSIRTQEKVGSVCVCYGIP
jgi:hypothetical protein